MNEDRVSLQPSDKVKLSDAHVKQYVAGAGTLPDGLKLYKFKYLWDETEYVGVMAQDVMKVRPDAVSVGEDGYYRVNYAKMGIRMMTTDEWYAEQDHQNCLEHLRAMQAHSVDSPEPPEKPSDIRLKRDVQAIGRISPEPPEKTSDIRLKRDIVEIGLFFPVLADGE